MSFSIMYNHISDCQMSTDNIELHMHLCARVDKGFTDFCKVCLGKELGNLSLDQVRVYSTVYLWGSLY